MQSKIKHIQQQIKSKGGYITKEQAERYLELVCKIRNDDEEAEKRQILIQAKQQTEPAESGESES